MTELAERLAGAVWGHLVGDAVGVPYEFRDSAAVGQVRFVSKPFSSSESSKGSTVRRLGPIPLRF